MRHGVALAGGGCVVVAAARACCAEARACCAAARACCAGRGLLRGRGRMLRWITCGSGFDRRIGRASSRSDLAASSHPGARRAAGPLGRTISQLRRAITGAPALRRAAAWPSRLPHRWRVEERTASLAAARSSSTRRCDSTRVRRIGVPSAAARRPRGIVADRDRSRSRPVFGRCPLCCCERPRRATPRLAMFCAIRPRRLVSVVSAVRIAVARCQRCSGSRSSAVMMIAVDLRRDQRVDPRRRQDRHVLHAVERVHVVLALEQRAIREQLVRDHAEREQIGARVDRGPSDTRAPCSRTCP